MSRRNKSDEFTPKVLTVPEIREFHVCELYYKCKNIDGKQIPFIDHRESMLADFEIAIKKVASFFFYKKQGGNTPSYTALLNRWEKLWFPKDVSAYDIMIRRNEVVHNNLVTYSNMAAGALHSFHEDFKDDTSIPIAIDETFYAPLSREVRLVGQFDLVLKKDDIYKVIKWSGRPHKPSSHHLRFDFAALKYGFEHNSSKYRRTNYYLYDLTSDVTSYTKIEQPTDGDVKTLIHWGNRTADSIEFSPRRGFTAYCRACPFDTECQRWYDWNNR